MRSICTFMHDQRGNVLMLTGLAILILFATAGAGVDFGRQQLVRMKLQNASDAAAIAAASMPESTSAEQRRAVALRYYNLNYPTTYLGVDRPTPNIQIGSQIIVDASASLDANFVSNVGVEQLAAQGRTVVDRAEARNSIYDVILVMDNSGSMSDPTVSSSSLNTPRSEVANARALKLPSCEAEMRRTYASRGCAGPQYMADGVTIRNYNAATCLFNAPREFCSYVTNGVTTIRRTPPNVGYYAPGFGFEGNARLNALRSVAHNFVTRIIDEGEPGSRIGLIPWSDEVTFPQPMTTNGTTVRNALDRMGAWGATNPFLAMTNANTMAAGFNLQHVRAVVLMSDGKPTRAGVVVNGQTDTAGCNGRDYCAAAVSQTLALCTQLKNSGVQVYTVGFLDPTDSEFAGNPADYNRAVTFLRSCASVDGEGNPRYYTAQNGNELDQAFGQILTSLGRIRITQ